MADYDIHFVDTAPVLATMDVAPFEMPRYDIHFVDTSPELSSMTPIFVTVPFYDLHLAYSFGVEGVVDDPPQITNVVPASGTPINLDDPISFDLSDDTKIVRSVIVVEFPGVGSWDVVHDGDNFAPNYRAGSSVVDTVDEVTGAIILRHFELRRVGGWPAASEVRLRVYAVDGGGNEV